MTPAPVVHRVFVSSTFEDLKRHRGFVIDWLREAGFFVDPMENWQSESDEPRRFSLERMKGCDVCVLLVAFRRGFIPSNSSDSIAQLEYRYAIDHGIEVLPFLLDEDAPWQSRFNELDKDPGIRAWREDLRHRHGMTYFGLEPRSIKIEAAIARWQGKLITSISDTDARLAQGVERERKSRSINRPNDAVPEHFHDRDEQTGVAVKFLRDRAHRVMTVVGRGGVGKTAMVCRLLEAVEGAVPIDDGQPLHADGLVYLSGATGSHPITFASLYGDLRKLLPRAASERLQTIYEDQTLDVEAKMTELLNEFPNGLTVVLLDNFEDVVNSETRCIAHSELAAALRTILENGTRHGIKVIVTTQIAPVDLARVRFDRQRVLSLDEGLPPADAVLLLRELDADGTLGLKSASEEILKEACERTRGYPRALVALVQILHEDRGYSLREILDDTERLLPDNVMDALVGNAFSRLDYTAMSVMQSLAIYGRPVSPVAVDFLLQPYLPTIDSAPVLSRLLNVKLTAKQKDHGYYYLHPIDLRYALGTIGVGPSDGTIVLDAAPFTPRALRMRAADYFAQTRPIGETPYSIEDLESPLAEFELRVAAEDYEQAHRVLRQVDEHLSRWGHHADLVERRRVLDGGLIDPRARQHNHASLAMSLRCLGELDVAVRHAEQALAIASKGEDLGGVWSQLGNLGLIYYERGDVHKSIDLHTQALATGMALMEALSQATASDPKSEELSAAYKALLKGLASNMNNLGNAQADVGQLQQAVECYLRSIDLRRQVGDRLNEGITIGNLGRVRLDLGEADEALRQFQSALQIADDMDNRLWRAIDRFYLGLLHLRGGRHATAEDFLNDGLRIAEKASDRRTQSRILYCMGEVSVGIGDLSRARREYEKGLAFGLPSADFSCGVKLGILSLAKGNRLSALRYLDDAIARCTSLLQTTPTLYEPLCFAGLAHLAAGRTSLAVDLYRRASAVCAAPGVLEWVRADIETLQRSVSDIEGITDVLEVLATPGASR